MLRSSWQWYGGCARPVIVRLPLSRPVLLRMLEREIDMSRAFEYHHRLCLIINTLGRFRRRASLPFRDIYSIYGSVVSFDYYSDIYLACSEEVSMKYIGMPIHVGTSVEGRAYAPAGVLRFLSNGVVTILPLAVPAPLRRVPAIGASDPRSFAAGDVRRQHLHTATPHVSHIVLAWCIRTLPSAQPTFAASHRTRGVSRCHNGRGILTYRSERLITDVGH